MLPCPFIENTYLVYAYILLVDPCLQTLRRVCLFENIYLKKVRLIATSEGLKKSGNFKGKIHIFRFVRCNERKFVVACLITCISENRYLLQ